MENEADLVFEDWKMTKDRIKHFDNVIIRLRLEGISIAGAIIGVGLASFKYTSSVIFTIGNSTISATSIVILLGAFYLLPVLALDVLHFQLLMLSVKHARQIEQQEKYKGKLQITTKLTSHTLTMIHRVVTIIIYIIVLAMGLWLAYAVNFVPNSS